MDSITNNPFRIIGLSANCTEKELQRQRAKLTALANVNKKIESDYDFQFFPQITRNNDSLNSAVSLIENPKNKLINALFWFTSSGNSDDLAFEYLRSGKIDKASGIWNKVAESSSISPRQCSASNNWLTLTLLNAFSENRFSSSLFNWAVESKLELLESENFEQFSELILNRQEKINSKDIAKQFLTMLVSNLEKHFSHNKIRSEISIDVSEVVRVCNQCSPEIKDHYLNQLATSPEKKAENALQEIINRPHTASENLISFGEELYRRTRKELKALKVIFGKNSIRYEMLADKISRQILEFAIDYFDANKENPNLDPSWRTMRLFHRAESIAVSETIKDRVEVNISGLQGWIDNKIDNEKYIWLEKETQKIVDLLENFQQRTVSSRVALQLAEQSRPILRGIGGFLGFDDENYLKLSDAIVLQAVGMVAKSLEQQERIYLVTKNSTLPTTVSEAIKLHKLLDTFDMSAETRIWFKKNDTELSSINNFVLTSESIKAQSQATRVRTQSNAPSFAVSKSNSTSLFWDFVSEHPFVTVGAAFFILLIGIKSLSLFDSSNNSSKLGNTNAITNRSNVVNNIPIVKPSISPIKPIKTLRLQNGQSIATPDKKRGYGALFVENGTYKDAIAKLVDVSSGKTYRQVYIRSNSNFKIDGIRQGTFELKFSLGEGYSPELQKFTTNESFERFDEKLEYTTISNSTGIQWKEYRVTLNTVAYGTARTSSISADDFKDK